MMKLKKLLCFLLALSLLLCLYGCSFPTVSVKQTTQATEEPATEPNEQTNPPKESTVTPLLYKVTDANGNVLWLFGSIHVGYDDFYPLPDYVYDAYESADAIAFEIDMLALEDDTDAMIDALLQMAYTDGSTIKDHIDPELYEVAVEILKDYGYYAKALDVYMPVLWSSFLDGFLVEETGLDSSLGVDYHLLDKAYADGKEILEVESAEFQYGMMASFSPALQEVLLESSVAAFFNIDAAKADMEMMVDLWASGDEAAFAAYLTDEGEFESEEERKLYEEYNNAMVVERNISMTDYAENALKSGKEVFICVGAAHIVGEGAMADLLRERGYTVTKITPVISI